MNARKINKIDAMAYAGGLAGNAAAIPQIIKAWQGPAPGLSVLTWILFICVNVSWLIYAIHRKQMPLLITQVVGIIFNAAVVLGWLINAHVF